MKRHLPWLLIALLFLISASSALLFVYIASKNAPEWLPVEEDIGIVEETNKSQDDNLSSNETH